METLIAHNAYQLWRLDSAEGFAGLLGKHRGQGQRDHLAVEPVLAMSCDKITACAVAIERSRGYFTSEHGNLRVRQGNCSKLSPSVDVDIASRTDLQLLPPLR